MFPLNHNYSTMHFAIFGAIILGGFPDYESDKETGKRTLTVILGKRNASLISLISIFISLIFSINIIYSSMLGFASIFFIIVIFHGMIIIYFLFNLLMANKIESRIDKLLQMSLSYILWFTLIPLFYLLNIF